MTTSKSKLTYFHFVSFTCFTLALGSALFFSHDLVKPRTDQNITSISEVQGSGKISPLAGQALSLEGVVTGDFQRKEELKGFFIQDLKGDGDSKTSDGIFVYVLMGNKLSKTDVKIGQRVRVGGTIAEYRGQTQIEDITEITVIDNEAGRNNQRTPIQPMTLKLPLAQGDDLENYEGMIVTFAGLLNVTGNYNLGGFGEIELASGGRIFAPNNGDARSPKENGRRMILLDDGSTKRNPQPTPYLDEINTRRVGDTVAGVTGVLAFSHDSYRVQPIEKPVFTRSNPRPEKLALPDAGWKIATFNVHNYFTTLKSEKKSARGATTAEEFATQSAKVVTAIKAIDADIVGLMEIENNGDKAIGDLVAKLNAAYGAEVYAFVPDPETGVGDDMIKVAAIYKIAKITRVGDSLSDSKDVYSRIPIAQTFQGKDGSKLTVVINHFKSKGSCPRTGDIDDGQGCWNDKRVLQAETLLQFIKKLQVESGDADVLTIGDYNSYLEEDPIKTLVAGGLKNLSELMPAAQRYSHQFDAHSGLLDYAFATPSLRTQVVGATVWHINADEPETESQNLATPYRSSDHDPVVVALKLDKSATAVALR